MALTHWGSSISCLPSGIQDLIIHIESGVWRRIVSLLLMLSNLILRVAPPQSILPLIAVTYKLLKFLIPALHTSHLSLQIQAFPPFLIVEGLKLHDLLPRICASASIISVLLRR